LFSQLPESTILNKKLALNKARQAIDRYQFTLQKDEKNEFYLKGKIRGVNLRNWGK
jgi:hypothetical protein